MAVSLKVTTSLCGITSNHQFHPVNFDLNHMKRWGRPEQKICENLFHMTALIPPPAPCFQTIHSLAQLDALQRRVFRGQRGQGLVVHFSLLSVAELRLLFHVARHRCGLGGRTDAPSCRLLFSRSANERPGAADPRSNESSGVWARIESWVVQSVRRTTISPECTGWMRGGDGNVTELFPNIKCHRCSNEHS